MKLLFDIVETQVTFMVYEKDPEKHQIFVCQY